MGQASAAGARRAAVRGRPARLGMVAAALEVLATRLLTGTRRFCDMMGLTLRWLQAGVEVLVGPEGGRALGGDGREPLAEVGGRVRVGLRVRLALESGLEPRVLAQRRKVAERGELQGVERTPRLTAIAHLLVAERAHDRAHGRRRCARHLLGESDRAVHDIGLHAHTTSSQAPVGLADSQQRVQCPRPR